MEADPNTAWGKNKPLEKFWQDLASGRKVVLIYKNKSHKIYTLPTGKVTSRKIEISFNNDPDIVAILTSAQSTDSYERLYPKAKNKSVDYVIKNYKKYFRFLGPTPKNLVAKGESRLNKLYYV